MRLVLSPDNEVVVDWREKLPGRGAWVHPQAACVDKLDAKGGIVGHALDGGKIRRPLREQMTELALAGVLDGLSLAAAAGALIGGHDMLLAAIADGTIVTIILAEDASPRTVEDLRRAAGDAIPFTVVAIGRDALGGRIGRGARAAVGVTSSRAASHLRAQLRRLRSLG